MNRFNGADKSLRTFNILASHFGLYIYLSILTQKEYRLTGTAESKFKAGIMESIDATALDR
jgi:hypothetical protein